MDQSRSYGSVKSLRSGIGPQLVVICHFDRMRRGALLLLFTRHLPGLRELAAQGVITHDEVYQPAVLRAGDVKLAQTTRIPRTQRTHRNWTCHLRSSAPGSPRPRHDESSGRRRTHGSNAAHIRRRRTGADRGPTQPDHMRHVRSLAVTFASRPGRQPCPPPCAGDPARRDSTWPSCAAGPVPPARQ